LQRIVAYVEPQDRQQLVAHIIGELDEIERIGWASLGAFNDDALARIDDVKQEIIAMLEDLATASGVAFTLPLCLTDELFETQKEADLQPEGRERNFD
jgi:hypothetical protein